MEKWFVSAKKADFNKIGNKFGIDPVIARVIRNREHITEDEIEHYLNGGLENLYSPWKLKDMNKAVKILQKKIKEKKKIRIISDYDVDGVISNYILLVGLRRCGADVDFKIPNRIKDGYGINEDLILEAKEEGIDTIVTCDNGIAAIDQIAYAKELGMTVIVTDHHDIPFVEEEGKKKYLTSKADAIINPKQIECEYPFSLLCGAAVAYKLIEACYEAYGIKKEEITKMIGYVAIATVCDVVDLIDENRIIAKEGLKLLNHTENIGLQELLIANSLEDKPLSSYHLGFVIGPCINASGRLESAKLAVDLLLCEEREKAAEMAKKLKQLNDERKNMTEEGVEKAIEIVESTKQKDDLVLVIYLEDCHESLAGIIAGRVREKYNKPVFVITKSEVGLKGSGRSIEAYNMFEEITKCKHLLTKFGGHPMAAGLSIPTENLDEFRQLLNKNTVLTKEDIVRKIVIDVPMPIDYVSEELIEQLDLLEPFGKANQKPLFAEKNLKFLSARILGKNRKILKYIVENEKGCQMEALFFGDIEEIRKVMIDKFGLKQVEYLYQGRKNNIRMSLTYYPSMNEFRGVKTLQIVIQNYQ
ncbi:MAG: single-stranded-DNA-specific exonuclease RecJ [Lachnospiraceae bacterium]